MRTRVTRCATTWAALPRRSTPTCSGTGPPRRPDEDPGRWRARRVSRHRLGSNLPTRSPPIDRSFAMPRFVSKDGKHSIETSNPVERVSLLRQGYTEQKARTKAVRQADQQATKTADTSGK